MANPAAGEAKNQQSVVLTLRLLVVHQGRSPGHDFYHGIFFPEEITSRFNAMTTEIMHCAAPCFCDVPEVSAVRPAMRLSGANPEDPSYPASLDDFTCLHNGWRKNFSLSVSVEGPGPPGSIQHCPGFKPVSRQGLGADLISFGFGQSQRCREVFFIR